MTKDKLKTFTITIDTSDIDSIHTDDLDMEIKAILAMSFDIDEDKISVLCEYEF